MVKNFSEDFPVSPKVEPWGIFATSFGQAQVPPHSPYPPPQHPGGPHSDSEHRHTLHAYQLLYIREGGGTFQSALTKSKKVPADTIIILFPEIWHRYWPDSSTGWTETWIEMNGPYIDQLVKGGIISPDKPMYRVHSNPEVELLFDRAAEVVRAKPPSFTVYLGLIAVQILTLLSLRTVRRKAVLGRMQRLISDAQVHLARDLDSNVSAEDVAKELGIGYSYFRREFKRLTGLSPKQYRIEIRYRRVQEMLRNTNLSLKEISEKLGYNSVYHLSFDFVQRMGVPPSRWRSENRIMTAKASLTPS